MVPKFPDMQPLSWDHCGLLLRFLNMRKRKTCELSLAHCYLWEERYRPQLTMINGNLCILLSPPEEKPFFLEPLGNNMIDETVEACLQHAGRLSRLSEDFMSRLSIDRYKIRELPNHFDYLYMCESLAEFKGRHYDGKRNHIKRFRNENPSWEYHSLSPKHCDDALTIFNQWASPKIDSGEISQQRASSYNIAIAKSFELFTELDIVGGVITIEGQVVGIIIGSMVNDEMLSFHFHYGLPEIKGLYSAMLNEAAIAETVPFINLEQDDGVTGLRKSKLFYHPERMEKKYEIIPMNGITPKNA